MPWLRGGTVAVINGSTTVVGTNADFAANSRVGDAFVGPDGINYEIGNVASATVISIIPAYKGPTASGVAYAIMPVQGYPKALADAFNNINLQWGPKLAALGTTGNYDVLPASKGGTGISDLSVFIQTLLNDQDAAAGRGTLGAARSGPNNDITSLTGLTTALSVVQGGTGVGTTAALLAVLQAAGAYGKSNIVGAVSQSGGVPTGAVVEIGTSAAGNWTKWADGTMICRKRINTDSISNVNTGVFISGAWSAGNWPVPFVEDPIVSAIGIVPGAAWTMWAANALGTNATSAGSWRGVASGTTTQGCFINISAIGRWY